MNCLGNVLLAVVITIVGASLLSPDLADLVKQQTAAIIKAANDTQTQALAAQQAAAKALQAANDAQRQAEAAKKKYEELSQSCRPQSR